MYKRKSVYLILLCICTILVGCLNNNEEISEHEEISENPTTFEELIQEPEADIFMFNGLVYQANIEWVDELTLIAGEKIGEITDQAVDGNSDYTNGMSNKLPIGTVLYKVEENSANENKINEDFDLILIADDNGNQKYYLAATEG